MTIDERTVTTALRAYARGIDVTDDDLDRLEARMDERLHPAPRRYAPHPWQLAVAACAVVALVLAVTALWRTRVEETMPATPSITPADLAGVWMVDAEETGGWLWHFTPDGRVGYSNTGPDYVTVAENRRPYRLDGDRISLPGPSHRCEGTVTRLSEGRLALTPVAVDVQCDQFLDGTVWDFVRVSPASVAGTSLTENPEVADRRPAAEPQVMTDVAGTWLFEGTGTVLVILRTSPREGAYFLDDEGDGVDPDKRGTVLLPTEGGLVLRPAGGEEEQSCDTVFSQVVTTGVALEVKLAESSCGRLGAGGGTWVRLS